MSFRGWSNSRGPSCRLQTKKWESSCQTNQPGKMQHHSRGVAGEHVWRLSNKQDTIGVFLGGGKENSIVIVFLSVFRTCRMRFFDGWSFFFFSFSRYSGFLGAGGWGGVERRGGGGGFHGHKCGFFKNGLCANLEWEFVMHDVEFFVKNEWKHEEKWYFTL